MFIKICGITSKEDFEFIAAKNVSAIGFVAYPKSPRYVAPEKVKEILSGNTKILSKVGVFVNASYEEIMEYAKAGIDTAQLHGDEPPELAEKLSDKLEVWKAIKPQNKSDVEKYTDYPADKFLIDAFSKEAHGGTGKKADWELAKLAVDTLDAPVLLAGGINSQNAAEAIEKVSPFGLDLSSGVEISPGVKDHKLVDEFMEKFRKIIYPESGKSKLFIQIALSALAALMLGAAGASFINENSMFFFKRSTQEAFPLKQTSSEWLTALEKNDAKRAILLADKMAQRDEISLPEYDYLNIYKSVGVNSQALTDGFNKVDFQRWKDAHEIKKLAKSLIKSDESALSDIFQAVNKKIKVSPGAKKSTSGKLMQIWNSGSANINEKYRFFCELAKQTGWSPKIIILQKNGKLLHIFCELQKDGKSCVADFSFNKFWKDASIKTLVKASEIWPANLKDALKEKIIILYPAEFADFRPVNQMLAERLKNIQNPDLPILDENPLKNFQGYLKKNAIDKNSAYFNYWRNPLEASRNAQGFPKKWIKKEDKKSK